MWQQHNNGQRWRVLPDHSIEVEGQGVVRSSGDPITVRTLLEDYGHDLREASERFGVPLSWLVAIVCIESVHLKTKPRPDAKAVRTYHRDAQSIRWEKRTRARPSGEYSGGLMQVLESTAQATARKHGLGDITLAKLLIPRYSLLVGAAYYRDQLDRYEGDPILAQAAYNAGSVRNSSQPWGFVTHADDRPLRFAQWVNDAVAVLEREDCVS